jgi:hypothetical protein
MSLSSWIEWINFAWPVLIWPVIAANVYGVWRGYRLNRKWEADNLALITERSEVAELHFTLTWIFVQFAAHDTLPWWRMWSASMHQMITKDAEEDRETFAPQTKPEARHL